MILIIAVDEPWKPRVVRHLKDAGDAEKALHDLRREVVHHRRNLDPHATHLTQYHAVPIADDKWTPAKPSFPAQAMRDKA